MATIQELAKYAQTAQAAYGNDLVPGIGNAAVYASDTNMASSEASLFDSTWSVIQQSIVGVGGFSAVLFENNLTHEKVLAIRGTQPTDQYDWLTDLVDIAIYGSVTLSPQYVSLELFYQQLLSSGNLGPNEQIVVTGHSLGGFLAAAFAARHDAIVSAAYTFNAPGFGGTQAEMLSWLGIVSGDIANSKITNVRAQDGLSIAAGLGQMLGVMRDVRIEPGVLPGSNHAIHRLVDSLAVQGAIGTLDPALPQSTANDLVLLASNQSDDSLTTLLDAVRRQLLGPTISASISRNDLYSNLDALKSSSAFALLAGTLRVNVPDSTTVADAKARFSSLLALELLSPIALSGIDMNAQAQLDATLGASYGTVYALWQADQGLTEAERTAGMANFSNDWLVDRAAMLDALVARNRADSGAAASVEGGLVYRDQWSGLLLAGTANPDLPNSRQIIFGSNNNDVAVETLTGGSLSDRIYGGGGNDTLIGDAGDDLLDGGAGDDVLEGGAGVTTALGGKGHDTYRHYTGDGVLNITDSDGDGLISIQIVESGQTTRSYVLGNDTISQVPGTSNAWVDSHDNRFVLANGVLNVQLEDGGQIIVHDFASSDLGITLSGPPSVTPPSGSTSFTVGAPNQDIPNQDATSENLYGWYRASGADGGSWLSPGALFHRGDSEVISASAAIEDAANHQNAVAATKAGMGDSYVTGDGGNNVIVDDWVAHFDDAVGGIYGEYQMAPAMGNDHIDAGGGDDVVLTHGGNDTVSGGLGNDVIVDTHAGWEARFDTQTSYLYAWGSTEWIDQPGHASNDQLSGDAGNDFIAAHGGNQTMDGGDDNDELYAGAGNDILTGGAGDDLLAGDIHLTASPLTGTYDSLGYLSSLTLDPTSFGSDTASCGNDILDGADGNDTLLGGGGNDVLIGGAGADRIQGDFLVTSPYTELRAALASLAADPLSIQGNDTIQGGSGADQILGGGGDDVIDAGDDDDTVYAGAGDDSVSGGTGIDYLVGDDQTGPQGADQIHAGDGADTLFGGGGDDKLYGDAGDDTLVGGFGGSSTGTGDDRLEGGDGDDALYGQDGNDTLIGGGGHDTLQGDDGDDRLETDSGGDVLLGGAGNDTYVLGPGAGAAQITDSEGANKLVFGAGVGASDVKVTRSAGLVYIDFSPSDYVYMSAATFDTLAGATFNDGTSWARSDLTHAFIPGAVATTHAISLGSGVAVGDISYHALNNDLILAYSGSVTNWVNTGTLVANNVSFETGDGAQWGLAAGTKVLVLTNWYLADPATHGAPYVTSVLPAGSGVATNFNDLAYTSVPRVIEGTDGVDLVQGTDAGDTLRGLAGTDLLEGGGGDDDLTGGADSDAVFGGAGDDTYRFSAGDGSDLIVDAAGTDDVVRFGAGIRPASLTVTETTAGLQVQVGDSAADDQLLIANWSQGSAASIDRFVFDDGTSLDRAAIDALNTGNHSPRVVAPIAQQNAILTQPFQLPVSSLFADADAGDTLTLSAQLATGDLLPAWLGFDPQARLLTGTPGAGDSGDLSVRLVATDAAGLSTYSDVAIHVQGTTTLDGTSGDDVITAPSIDFYAINGQGGNDILTGGAYADTLDGGAGVDILGGQGGDDLLVGGAGNDTVQGGAGNDTIVFNRGDGADRVYGTPADAASTDTLRLGAGILPSQVAVSVLTGSGDLLLTLLDADGVPTSDTIAFYGYYNEDGPSGYPNRITFDSDPATVWTAADLLANLNTPTTGDDYVYGSTDADSIDGLAGNDWVAGLGGDDTLSGNDGVDKLYGGDGNDTLSGGNGNDSIGGDAGNDSIDGGAGADFIGGDEGDDVLHGGADNDILLGGAGNDYLTGDSGVDQLYGGDGDDTYEIFGGQAGNTIYEYAGGGTDTVLAWTSYTLGTSNGSANVENVILQGSINNSATGNALDNHLVGNSAANVLSGGAGNDTLDGGAWADTMSGGTGDDTFIVDNVSDTVSENAGEGTDMVQSSVNYILGANVENLTLTGTASVNATGNALDNVLTGNAGANRISGGGGDDTLNGGAGDDTYLGFGTASGDDLIIDASGADVIQFDSGQDTTPEQLQITRSGDDLVIAGPNQSSITVRGWYASSANGIEQLQLFEGGLQFNYAGAEIQGRADGVNTAPTVNAVPIAPDARTGSPYVLQLAVNTFADIDSQHSLSYSATLADGSALPAWLAFDAAARTLAGTPPADSSGTLNVAVVATDAGGLSASATFAINIVPGPMIGTSGNDVLVGDASDNVMEGLGGDDYLDGGSGADTMYGGDGNDIYVVDGSGDFVSEDQGGGTDEVRSSISFTLDVDLDNLTLTGTAAINGTGNALDNVLIGNAGSNTLTGGAGNDTLDPGSAGTDTLRGGTGNDTYIVTRSSGVTIAENAGEGTDTVQASVTCTLGSNLENLTLTGSSAINGTGNTLANVLTGNGAANTLSGGSGADTLIGGAGNDTYVVDNAGDVVIESAGEGIDLVQSSVSYAVGGNVENLTLSGSSAINGTGNALDNVLTGNSGSNTLTGGAGNDTLNPGSSGTDKLLGGSGDDTYVIARSSGITITENAGEGTDTVQSSVTWTLGSNLENLALTGMKAINGTGNTLDNALTGNSASNTLTGGAGNDTLDPGSAGTDRLIGGVGNDTYVVNRSRGITITEKANEGVDAVLSSVAHTLGSNIELLFLSGSSAVNGTGNTLANLLRGSGAVNTLLGGGGTDILEGGDGNDALSNVSGNTLLNGGAGADTLSGAAGNDLLIGGPGNDALTTGSGADIIVFNKGDGSDMVAASTTADNTLSLGGGTLYADLLFQKSGNDLILHIGATDEITLTDYYASSSNRSVGTLQVVIEGTSDYDAGSGNALNNRKIESFDFAGLVAAFDAALAAQPDLGSWALTNALAAQYLSGSDTAAVGGDLAYRYAMEGSLANISFTPALGILGATGFGSSAQALQPVAALQDATPRLN
jgi:Ca2+-binding RTX toxin-like protein